MRRFSLLLMVALLAACGGPKTTVTQKPTAPVGLPDSLQINIVSVDRSSFPQLKIHLSVKDRNGLPVLGFAPPYATDDRWREYWQPLAASHAKFGADSLIDFTVEEHRPESPTREGATSQIERLSQNIALLQSEIKKQEQGSRELQEVKRSFAAGNKPLPARANGKKPSYVVLVIDRSGSMSGAPLEEAKKAIIKYVTFMEANFAVVAFDNLVEMVAPFNTSAETIIRKVEMLSSRGGTHLHDALYQAIGMLQNVVGDKQVIALTDGQTSGDQYTLEQIINFANSGNVSVEVKTGNNAKIFSIGLGFQSQGLISLAEKTGGKHYYANTPAELSEVFGDLVLFQLGKINKATDPTSNKRLLQAYADSLRNLAANYYYLVSFKTAIAHEDGMARTFSFRLGKRNVSDQINIPVSNQMMLSGSIVSARTTERVPWARISIRPQGADTVYTATADSTGHFTILLPRLYANYTIFVEADGNYFIEVREEALAARRDYYLEQDFALKALEQDVSVAIRTIHFENNEYIFEPVSLPDLVILGNYFAKRKNLKLEISGHTDSFGSDTYNQWLSERRAEQVEEFFASLGIPQENMLVKGYGESRPIPDVDRYAQRRVEIKVLEIMNP